MGCVIGLMSPTLKGPRHILQRTSKLTRKMVKGSLGADGYALSEMVDNMSSLRDSHVPFRGVNRGVVGLGDCESLCTRLRTKKMVAEK